MKKITAAVVGATGYTGQALLRILEGHKNIEKIIAVSSSKNGEKIQAFDNGFWGSTKCDNIYHSVKEAFFEKPDVVFAALPHLKSAEICEPFFENSVVIDLSADFRIKDENLFFQAYGQKPPRPDLLEKAVFGLCEIYREDIKSADLIANPGCYPTCTTLPLFPIVKALEIEPTVVVNALSGVSGAGRKAVDNLLFCSRSENCGAYSAGKMHRHMQEIEKELKTVKSDIDIYFTPHLVPLKQGMEVTTFVTLKKEISNDEIAEIFNKAYSNEPFIRLLDNQFPQTAFVRNSNRVDISWQVFGNKLILFSVQDNLVKGASGQAVQNMNIRFGFEETEGLRVFGDL